MKHCEITNMTLGNFYLVYYCNTESRMGRKYACIVEIRRECDDDPTTGWLYETQVYWDSNGKYFYEEQKFPYKSTMGSYANSPGYAYVYKLSQEEIDSVIMEVI